MSAQINLLPKKGFADSTLGSLLEFFSTYGRYIIVITQLVVLVAFFSRFRLDRELTDLQDAVEQKEAIITDLQSFESEVRLLQERLKNIHDLKQGHDFVRSALVAVKDMLPPGTVLDNLNIRATGFNVDGSSVDQEAFAGLLATLRYSDELDNISFSKISKAADSDVIEFSFSANVKNYTQQAKVEANKEIVPDNVVDPSIGGSEEGL